MEAHHNKKTYRYNIEHRVASECGIRAVKAKEVIDTFLDVLKEECSILEDGESISYLWLTFRCKKIKERVLTRGVRNGEAFPLEEPVVVDEKLVLKVKVKDSFYADKKKGLEGNWYV